MITSKESRDRWIIKRFGSKTNFYQQYCRKYEIKYGRVTGRLRGKHIIPLLGENNPNWQGGITTENNRIRTSIEYKLWREAVFKRDDYTCIWCFQKGVYLEADHIKSFAHHPELRFAIDNGRTLCKDCHETTDTYKGRNNRNKNS